MRTRLLLPLFLLAFSAIAQDRASIAAIGRKHLDTLASEGFHGRGYVNGGDSIAADYIAAEFGRIGLKPLKDDFFQPFQFKVNTFPDSMRVTIDGKELRPGFDYIVDECPFAKGATSIAHKEILNQMEEASPGAKHNFLFGYLDRAAAAGVPGAGDTLVGMEADRASEIAGTAQDTAGQLGSPHWKHFVQLGYTMGRFNGLIDWRWYQHSKINNQRIEGFAGVRGASINEIPNLHYTALSLNYDIDGMLGDWEGTVFARIDNLFDRRYEPTVGYNGRPRGFFVGASWAPRP